MAKKLLSVVLTLGLITGVGIVGAGSASALQVPSIHHGAPNDSVSGGGFTHVNNNPTPPHAASWVCTAVLGLVGLRGGIVGYAAGTAFSNMICRYI